MRYQTLTSTMSCYVIDTEKSKPVALYWMKTIPWAQEDGYQLAEDCYIAAEQEADRLNENPDELHYDMLKHGEHGLILVERCFLNSLTLRTIPAEGCFFVKQHTMDECEFGVPQS